MKPTRYIDIFETLEQRIKSGAIQVGEKLPTEVELSKEFGVNRHTVRRALKLLVEKRYIERRPRLGSVVVSLVPKIAKSETLTIKYLYFDDASKSDLSQLRALKTVCDRFNELNSGIFAEPLAVKRRGPLFSPYLPLNDDSGAVLIPRADYISGYAAAGVLLPLDGFEGIDETLRFLNESLAIETIGIDGAKYVHGLPVRMTTWMAAVNLTLFNRLGFSESDIPQTMDEFVDISAKLADKGLSEGIYPFEPLLRHKVAQSITRFLPYLHSISDDDGLFITDENGGIRIAEKTMLEFLQWISAMYEHAPYAPPTSQLFRNGRAVFRLSITPGFIESLREVMKDEVRAFPIPRSSTTATVVNATYAGIVAHSANTPEKREAAWRFLRHICGVESQRLMLEAVNDLPTRTDLAEAVSEKDAEIAAFFDFALKYGRKAYDLPCNDDLHRIVLRAFANVVDGASTPEGAVAEAAFLLEKYAVANQNQEHHSELEKL